jgi:hypothetical protein
LAGAANPLEVNAGATNAATGAGNAAASTANQIASQNNSWMQLVSGALGGVAGAVTGGVSKLFNSGETTTSQLGYDPYQGQATAGNPSELPSFNQGY